MEVTLTKEELQFLRAFMQGNSSMQSGYSCSTENYQLNNRLYEIQNVIQTARYPLPPPVMVAPIDEEARRRVDILESQIADLKIELSKQNPNWGKF